MLNSKYNFRILNEVLYSNWNIEIIFEDVLNKNKIPVIKALEKLKIEIEKEEKKETEILQQIEDEQQQEKINQHEKSKITLLLEIFILPYLIFYLIFEKIKNFFK